MSRLDPTLLRPYQCGHARLLALILSANHAALDASDTGTGKTYVALWLAKVFGATPLVICPKSVKHDWLQAAQVMGMEAEVVNYERVRGPRRNGKLASSDWGHEQASGSGSKWVWHQSYWFIIFDEVDRCGGMTSLNSKLLIAARRQCKFILGLSATAADDPRQLKALGFALRLFTLDRFKWWLLKHGCRPGVFGGFTFSGGTDGKKAMEKIHQEIFTERRGSRMRKNEIPGFPKSEFHVKLLPDETGKANDLAEELAARYQNAPELSLLTALRQELELLKVPHLIELASHYAQTSRVIIFVNFRKTAEVLHELVKETFHVEQLVDLRLVIDGDNDEAEREELKRRFQANEIPVLVCNVQAGGVGIGLHDPSGQVERTTLISPCYSARNLRQVLGRPHRDGGAFSSQYLVCFADTLEAKIASVVLKKLERLDTLNDATLNGVLETTRTPAL